MSADTQTIQNEIKRSRKEEKAWPRIHYLWEQNPVLDWINDKLHASFGRHEAPVLELQGALKPDEIVFVISGLIPNRKSHPLVHRWFGVCFEADRFASIEPFEYLVERTGLGSKPFPNPQNKIDFDKVRELLSEAVQQAKTWMSECRKEFEDEINEKLNEQLKGLEKLRSKQHRQLELKFEDSKQHVKIVQARKDKGRRHIDALFDDYIDWIEDTMTTEDKPYIQIIAVLKGLS